MSQFNKKLDLGWGNPYFLLQVLNNEITKTFSGATWDFMDVVYEKDAGNELLLEKCKQITEMLTGNQYKHYLITNGATQAINTIMRTWSHERSLAYCVTGKLGYPFYPDMISKNGLWQKKVELSSHYIDVSDEMVLIDSPSNPLGEQISDMIYVKDRENVVWDAVYHSKIYNANMLRVPNHEVFVNSFSKFLGLTGARVGWLATNYTYDYEQFKKESLYENATVSQPSQNLVLEILQSINIDNFMDKSRRSLERNRDIINGISSLVGGDVQEVGMFYSFHVDNKMIELFDRSDIGYVLFDVDDDKMMRLNIGQTSDILQKAVRRINKVDGRK